MEEMLDPAEFARRDGCPLSQVTRAQRLGKLPKGQIPASSVGGPWRKRNRRTLNKSGEQPAIVHSLATAAARHAVVQSGETNEQAAERIVAEGALLEMPAALQRKENYLGLLKQLEYDQKAGQVVAVADVGKRVAAEYAKVRTRLLAIPAERAPAIHRLKTVPEVEEALRTAIVRALEELTGDGTPALA